MVEFGKKIYPNKAQDISISADAVKGPFWSVEKQEEQYVLEYVSGGHGGGIKNHVVSREDFDEIANGDTTIEALMLKYQLS